MGVDWFQNMIPTELFKMIYSVIKHVVETQFQINFRK